MGSPNGFPFLFTFIRENNTPYYEEGSVTMACAVIVSAIIYVGFTVLEKLDKKEELKKAKENDYEIYFSN